MSMQGWHHAKKVWLEKFLTTSLKLKLVLINKNNFKLLTSKISSQNIIIVVFMEETISNFLNDNNGISFSGRINWAVDLFSGQKIVLKTVHYLFILENPN